MPARAAARAAPKATLGEPIVADVTDLSHDGRGVAEIEGRTVFVPGALPGERVRIRTRKRRRRYHEAELIGIVEPSADRVEPPCPYFGICGGCALQHLDYRAQIGFKQTVVAEALRRIGGFEPPAFAPAITGSQWHYRRRARLGIKHVAGKARVLVGFRERAAPLLTDMQACRILAPPMDRLPGVLAEVVARTSIKDRIPQAEIAVGDDSGVVVLRVLDRPTPADIDVLATLNELLDVDVYLQTGGPDTVAPIGRLPQGLHYTLEPDGIRIAFEPGDFVQINAEINRAMVAAAIESADLAAGDTVLDLYCGLGNLSLPIGRRVAEVTGVDGAAPLIARAGANAAQNGIGNVSFLAADLSEPGWPFLERPYDVVFLDPARAGRRDPGRCGPRHAAAPHRLRVLSSRHARARCGRARPSPRLPADFRAGARYVSEYGIMSRRSRCSIVIDAANGNADMGSLPGIVIDIATQTLELTGADGTTRRYRISTSRYGAGEREGSYQTPRGRHDIRARIGAGCPPGTVFVGRRPTGEIWSEALAAAHPDRDWILTRILWLSGLEPGVNRHGNVDTMRRYIYIHGMPDTEPCGEPGSIGCIRMRNDDIIELFDRVEVGTVVEIR